MRILIPTDAWTPQVNGVVTTLSMLTAELRTLGHEPVVVGPDAFRTLPMPGYPEIRLALAPYRRLAALADAAAPKSRSRLSVWTRTPAAGAWKRRWRPST